MGEYLGDKVLLSISFQLIDFKIYEALNCFNMAHSGSTKLLSCLEYLQKEICTEKSGNYAILDGVQSSLSLQPVEKDIKSLYIHLSAFSFQI